MQVFISHASSDRDLADRLSGKLREAGIDVWDPSSIFPGDNWALETGNALAQSEVMVVLYTKNAREIATLSQDVQYALTQGNYRGRVIPVFIGLSTVEAGKDVPWILLRLNPIWLEGDSPDLVPVVARVRAEIESGCNASA
ncbi:MAG TPA: toll/interleukin-1 receptor domain-containing protein [Pirellulales bacterium]|nr:toll/interleukin-1 receptor domain-containing protein [Pirellulales bacterium]